MAFIEVDVHQVHNLAVELGASGAKAAASANLAVRKTAFDIEADAKGLAPVDTGFLKNSIGTDIKANAVETIAEIGPTAEYGIWQEVGTSRMAAQPYMAPAFDRRILGLQRSLSKAAGEGIG